MTNKVHGLRLITMSSGWDITRQELGENNLVMGRD